MSPSPPLKTETITLHKCPECGGKHLGLVLTPLPQVRPTGHTHEGTCPATGTGIYAVLVRGEEPAEADGSDDAPPPLPYIPRKPAERRKFLARMRKAAK